MDGTAEWFQLALEQHRAGRLADAAATCQRVLTAEPDRLDCLSLLGGVAQQLGQAVLAEPFVERALALKPDDPAYQHHLAETLLRLGRRDAAAACCRRAIACSPDLAPPYVTLAIVLQQQGGLEDAVALLRRAIALDDSLPQAHGNLGSLMATRGRLDDAMAHFDRALTLAPDDPLLHANHGNVLLARGDSAAAVASFQRAHALSGDPAWRLKSALVLPIIPDSVAEIMQIRRRLMDTVGALRPLSLPAPDRQIGITAFHLAYHARDDLPLQRAIAALYAAACPALLATAPHCRERAEAARGLAVRASEPRRLRIGFASAFFRTHTIALLFQGVIAQLSRARFEVILLAPPCGPDRMRAALVEAADETVELPLDLDEARTRVAGLGLDILVYTDIGMSPLFYFLAFARLAPVQCVAWGHPDTTGIPAIDYFLSCDAMEPDGADAHYSERLVRLPGPTVYYTRPHFDGRLKDRAALGLDAADHLYVCPQSLFKFHPDFDDLLVALLRRDPAGRLVLLRSPHPDIDARLVGRLTCAAPDIAGRITLLPLLSRPDFVALLTASDVLLDPLHYSGGNTSLEAFSVGTPIVTWPGKFMRGRHTYGFYKLMDVMDCVARDLPDYLEIAHRLGTDPAWRATIRDRILATNGVLYENADTVRAMEEFFLKAASEPIT